MNILSKYQCGFRKGFNAQTLPLDKFESADFKIPVQKYPNKTFLIPNLRIFIFALNFKKNSRVLVYEKISK